MEFIREERQAPIKDRCRVLVAGGGYAGVSAALLRARGGADVLLLERGESCVPVTMATIPELRMTRRLVGETDVCARDDHRRCERSVGMFSDWTKRGPVYELPFGALYHPSVPNLLTAGRCLSAADDLWNVTRHSGLRRLRRGCRHRRGAGLRLPCSGHCRLAGNAPRAGRARASRRAVISVQIKDLRSQDLRSFPKPRIES